MFDDNSQYQWRYEGSDIEISEEEEHGDDADEDVADNVRKPMVKKRTPKTKRKSKTQKPPKKKRRTGSLKREAPEAARIPTRKVRAKKRALPV